MTERAGTGAGDGDGEVANSMLLPAEGRLLRPRTSSSTAVFGVVWRAHAAGGASSVPALFREFSFERPQGVIE